MTDDEELPRRRVHDWPSRRTVDPTGHVIRPDPIAEHLDRFAQARIDATEWACEEALQGGEHGVSVWTWPILNDAGMAIGLAFEARVDPDVPYGTIHDHEGPPP